MKYIIDGGQLVICANSFVDRSESPFIAIPLSDPLAQAILAEEIKLCPFCGDEGTLYRDTNYPHSDMYTWFVGCDFCHSESKRTKNRQGAIDAWNRRVGDDSPKA